MQAKGDNGTTHELNTRTGMEIEKGAQLGAGGAEPPERHWSETVFSTLLLLRFWN